MKINYFGEQQSQFAILFLEDAEKWGNILRRNQE